MPINWQNINAAQQAKNQDFYNRVQSANMDPAKMSNLYEMGGQNDSTFAKQAVQELFNQIDPSETDLNPYYKQYLLNNASKIRGQQMLNAASNGGVAGSSTPSSPDPKDFGSYLQNFMKVGQDRGTAGNGFWDENTARSALQNFVGNMQNYKNAAKAGTPTGWDDNANAFFSNLNNNPAMAQLIYSSGLALQDPWDYANGLGSNLSDKFSNWTNPANSGTEANWLDFYNKYIQAMMS